MFETLLITFREGLEAFLMVAIATVYLRQSGGAALVSAVRAGLALAFSVSAVLGYALAKLGAFSPMWEGLLALFAAACVVAGVFHMLRAGKLMARHISGALSSATTGQPRAWLAVFLFTFFMVSREGVETAAMLAALSGQAQQLPMLLGSAIGLVFAGGAALLWVRLGRSANLSRFFNVTAVFMLIFAATLLLRSFFEFTEIGLLPWVDNAFWHAASEPFVEGPFAQGVSLFLVLAPALWLLIARVFSPKTSASPPV